MVLDLDVDLKLKLWLSEHVEFWAAIQQREVLIKEGAVTQGNVTLSLRNFLPAFLILPAQMSKVTRYWLTNGQLMELPHHQHHNNRLQISLLT